MKTTLMAVFALLLCACSATGGNTQVYGEISTGIESSRTRAGR